MIAGLLERDLLKARKNMAVSQLWKKRKFVATAVLIELMDEEPRRKRGWDKSMDKEERREGFFNNIVRELMLEDTVAYREMMRMSYNDVRR